MQEAIRVKRDRLPAEAYCVIMNRLGVFWPGRFSWIFRMAELSPRVAVYPGSFDPITLGHLNVMERASQLFDKLIVGVGCNMEKQPLFAPEERQELIRQVTLHLPNLEIRTFFGLAVEFVHACNAKVMVRGVRPITDIPAELTMMMANRRLAPDVETLFMLADGDLAHVSSALIKQIAPLATDAAMAKFLPGPVIAAIRKKIKTQIT
jgi:pantetheine-phosphate adenylyltransferase